MTSRVRIGLIWLGVGLIATLADACCVAADAQSKLDATYRATLLGLRIGDVSWSVDLGANQFVSAASGSTAGMMRLFADGHGKVRSSGAVSLGRPVAARYALSIEAGRWSDTLQILFSGGEAREHLDNPPKTANPNRVPLTAADRKGVVDPMTALLIYIPGTGDTSVPAACERTLAVFDGRLRYDLRLSFKRLDKVQGGKGYRGAVVVCSVRFSPVAGHDPDRFLFKYMAAQRDMEIWLAPLAGSRLLVPYRVSVPTPIGLAILQATAFTWMPKFTRASAVNLD